MRSERRRWLGQALGLGTLALGGGLARAGNSLQLGQPAPPLVLHTLDGQTISTEALRGQVVIATFWATWCAPCREELPLLSDYAARHADRGLRVLGFSLDAPGEVERVRQVARSLQFPVGLLPSPWVAGYGRIWKLPVSFVIDRDGRLASNGWDEADPSLSAASLARLVDPLLARPIANT